MSDAALCTLLGIDFPLLQAGMGGIAGDGLVGAVSEAGAGGVLGLFRMRPAQVSTLVRATNRRTTKPYGVNLIPELMSPSDLVDQIETVLATAPPTVFFVFYGLPDLAAVRPILRADRRFLVKVGDVDAITTAMELGAAAVIVQGTEAGGHLLGQLPLERLVQEARDRGVRMPVVAAGGISLGGELRRLTRLGASGCMCGSLFAATIESRAHPLYKRALIAASARDTVVTERYHIGWPNRRHRVLRTPVTEQAGDMPDARFIGLTRIDARPFPIPRFSAFAPDEHTTGLVEEMAMYAGTSVDGIRDLVGAHECVRRFMAEYCAESVHTV